MFRIGLLGASRIARTAVIESAKRADGFVVSAVAARDPARARNYAREHGIPAVAENYAALIDRDDVDVVYNALPPAGHAPWTIAALNAGKAVLCEKPFARNAGEAASMVAAARASGQPLLEAFHYRFHPVMRRAEALTRENALGPPRAGAAEFNVAIARAPGELRWSADQGGGAMMDLGCYPLHATRTLIGAEPEIASAQAAFEDGVDAAMSAQLIFPGGVAVTIACSMIAPTVSAALRLDGERGSLEIVNFVAPQRGCRFAVTVNGRTREEPTDGPTTYEAQLAHLHAVLTGEGAPLTGGADAIANMTAIDAIYRSARS
ncbi:MAG: Gfo/Idh/MocA family protein [Caulobacteraceae bacterium]